jgi:DNA-binding MarR family transcriptional regulator
VDEPRSEGWPPASLAGRLAFLLKHVQMDFAALVDPALAPLDVDGRELGVLSVLADEEPLSQHQAAQRLAIDRTTMVALVDGLEGKGLARRRPDPGDRRRNLVEVTATGRAALTRTAEVVEGVERRFLAPLGEDGARRLKDALLTLVASVPAGTTATSSPGTAPRTEHE